MCKPIVLVLCCALFFPNSLIAQKNDTVISRPKENWFWRTPWPTRNVKMKGWEDVTVGIGFLSGRQIMYDLGAVRGPSVTSAMPTIYASYRYFFFRRIALGFTLGTQTLWGNSNYDNTGVLYTFKDFSSTFAIEITSVFLREGKIMLYARYGLGISYVEIKYFGTYPSVEDKFLANIQYTPFGIRLGKRCAAFMELGIGYKGLVNAGFSYNFRHKER